MSRASSWAITIRSTTTPRSLGLGHRYHRGARPPRTVGAADVRGGAGTRETDLLDPANSVRHVDAVVLTGGSAFRAGGRRRRDGLARRTRPRGGDGRRSCSDRARCGDLRSCRRRLGVPAHRGVQARRAAIGVGDRCDGQCRRRRAGAQAGALKGRRRHGIGATGRPPRRDGRCAGRGQRGGQRRRPRDRTALGGPVERRLGLTAPPAEQIAALAELRAGSQGRQRAPGPGALNTTIAVVATDHGPRTGVPARRGGRATVQPGPCDPAVPRSTATRCSRWPPGRWRCPRTPTPPAQMVPETGRSARSGAAAANVTGARGARRGARQGRSPGSHVPNHPPERSHNLIVKELRARSACAPQREKRPRGRPARRPSSRSSRCSTSWNSTLDVISTIALGTHGIRPLSRPTASWGSCSPRAARQLGPPDRQHRAERWCSDSW